MPTPKFDPKNEFTANEVRALVEDLKSEFRVVAEGVTALDERLLGVENQLVNVEERLIGVEGRLISVEDAVKLAIPSLNQRVSKLETKVGV